MAVTALAAEANLDNGPTRFAEKLVAERVLVSVVCVGERETAVSAPERVYLDGDVPVVRRMSGVRFSVRAESPGWSQTTACFVAGTGSAGDHTGSDLFFQV